MSGKITHSWNGTVLTITSDSGTSSADLKGDVGIRGPQGATGFTIGADGLIDTSGFATQTYVETMINDIREHRGLTSAQANLLLLILKNCVFTADTSQIIEALEESFSENTDIIYTIFRNIENIAIDNETEKISYGNAYRANISPLEDCELTSISISMGGIDITSSAYENGSIYIPYVNGDITISASAIKYEFLKFTGATMGYLGINTENTGMMVIKDTDNRAILLPLGMDLETGVTYRATIGKDYKFGIHTYSATGKGLDFSGLAASGGFWWRAGPRIIESGYVSEFEFTATAANEVLGVVGLRADNGKLNEEEFAKIAASFKIRKV